MLIMKLVTARLLGMAAISALAQVPSIDPSANAQGSLRGPGRDSLPQSNKASNIVPEETSSGVAPTLPSSGLSVVAATRDYLRAAPTSLTTGHTSARQSPEIPETSTLVGSVSPAQAKLVNGSPRVANIRDGLHALRAGDRERALRIIDVALAN
jgi:hypothetical protein